MDSQPTSSPARRLVPALGIGAICALLHMARDPRTFTAPASMIPGWIGDNVMFAWNLWWVSTAAWEIPGIQGLHCRMIFAPEGIPFVFHTHTWLSGMLGALIQTPWRLIPILGTPPGPVLTLNLLSVLSSGLSAIAVVALAQTFGVTRAPAPLLAALPAVFCGLRNFSMFGQLNILVSEMLLGSIAAHAAAVFGPPEKSSRRWLLGGVLSALALLNETIYGLLAGIFWLIAWLWSASRGPSLRARMIGLVSPLVMLAAGAPVLIALLRVLHSADYTVLPSNETSACDVLNLVLPADFNALWGGHMFALRGWLGIGGGAGTAFLGWANLWALGWAAALWARRRFMLSPPAAFWLIVASAGLLLTLGDRLVIAGCDLMPLPSTWLRRLPGLDNLRVPDRNVWLVLVPLALLTGHLVQSLLLSRRRAALAVFVGGWAVLFTSDALWRIDVQWDTTQPPLQLPEPMLAALRADEVSLDAAAVWTLPSSSSGRLQLWWQTQHRRPLVYGATARVSPAVMESRFEQSPFLRGVMDSSPPSETLALMAAGGPEALRAQMTQFTREHGVGFVLVRLDQWPEGEAFVTAHLPGATPIFRNDTLALLAAEGSPSVPRQGAE